LGARAQRFLARLVRGPDFLALREVFVPPREEAIARVAEPLPDDARVRAGNGADGLPLRLELLHLIGGLDPVGRVRERLGALAKRELELQVRVAFGRARGEELPRLRLDGIDRLPV